MYINSLKVKQGYYVKHEHHSHALATLVEWELEPTYNIHICHNCLESVTAQQHITVHIK